MEEEQDSKRLKLAVQELVKAAVIQTKDLDTKQVVDAIRDLKAATVETKDLDSKHVVDAIQDLKGQLQSGLDKMQSHLDKLALEARKQNLAWAISNAGLFSFEYYQTENRGSYYGGINSMMKSEVVVRAILFNFCKGQGYVIHEGAGMKSHDTTSDESRKAFRDKLVQQIYGLTGEKPVLKPFQSYFAIYMS